METKWVQQFFFAKLGPTIVAAIGDVLRVEVQKCWMGQARREGFLNRLGIAVVDAVEVRQGRRARRCFLACLHIRKTGTKWPITGGSAGAQRR
jgi:hypothetical protein